MADQIIAISHSAYLSKFPRASTYQNYLNPSSLEKHRLLHCVSFVAQMVKNQPASAGDAGSITGLGTDPGERHGYPLQYS